MGKALAPDPEFRPGVHAALLLIPLLLSQLVLQGGGRLAEPYLQQIAVEAHVRPDAAEVEYLTVLFGLILLCELVILIPSVTWWQIYGVAEFGADTESPKALIRHGLRIGVPYALTVYGLMWWTNSNPDFLRYTGMVGHRMPNYLVVAVSLGSFGALCEEFYFRRALLTIMTSSMPVVVAVGLNTLLFAAWHVHAFGNPALMLTILSGGAIYSVLSVKYGSMIPGAICHALVNTFAVLLNNLELLM
jgi:membrane protease YdiL (CAAX protease family)